jgi:hypothetical protein
LSQRAFVVIEVFQQAFVGVAVFVALILLVEVLVSAEGADRCMMPNIAAAVTSESFLFLSVGTVSIY